MSCGNKLAWLKTCIHAYIHATNFLVVSNKFISSIHLRQVMLVESFVVKRLVFSLNPENDIWNMKAMMCTDIAVNSWENYVHTINIKICTEFSHRLILLHWLNCYQSVPINMPILLYIYRITTHMRIFSLYGK